MEKIFRVCELEKCKDLLSNGLELTPNYNQTQKRELLSWLVGISHICSAGIIRDPISKKIALVENAIYEKDDFIWTDESKYLIEKYNAPVNTQLMDKLFEN